MSQQCSNHSFVCNNFQKYIIILAWHIYLKNCIQSKIQSRSKLYQIHNKSLKEPLNKGANALQHLNSTDSKLWRAPDDIESQQLLTVDTKLLNMY